MAISPNITPASKIVSFPSGTPLKQPALTPKPTVLSFVKKVSRPDSGYDFWCVKPSGNYTKDCDAGTLMALEYLNHRLQWFLPLQWIARDMKRRKISGLEIGFMSTVGKAATIGAALMARCDGDLSRLKQPRLEDIEAQLRGED